MALTDEDRKALTAAIHDAAHVSGTDWAVYRAVEQILAERDAIAREAVQSQGASIGRYRAALSAMSGYERDEHAHKVLVRTLSDLKKDVSADYDRAIAWAQEHPEDFR